MLVPALLNAVRLLSSSAGWVVMKNGFVKLLVVAAALILVSVLVIPAVSLRFPSKSTDAAAITSTSVPEAFSLVVFGAGLAGLGAVVRRTLR